MRIQEAYNAIPSLGVTQPLQLNPNQLLTNQITDTDASYTSAAQSISAVRAMVSMIHIMTEHPALCPSIDLPETLASLQSILRCMERALRAYQHTPLIKMLSRALNIKAEKCCKLLEELLSYYSNLRHIIAASVRYFIRGYISRRVGQGGSLRMLDLRVRECHKSFAACLLALGRWVSLLLSRLLFIEIIL